MAAGNSTEVAFEGPRRYPRKRTRAQLAAGARDREHEVARQFTALDEGLLEEHHAAQKSSMFLAVEIEERQSRSHWSAPTPTDLER